MQTTPVLAIDGGGTRCRIALKNRQTVMRVETGSANVSSDFSSAIAEILAGLTRLAKDAGVPLQSLSPVPAYVGLAGVTGPKIAERVTAALPLQTLKVKDDRPAALRGAIGRTDGFVMHCGTGSFVAAQKHGKIRLVGGWGAVLGDPASAQWVGRTALSRTLDVADGLVAASALSRALTDRFDDTAGIVAFAGAATPADLGSLAPLVTKAATNGDPLALKILQDAANDMAATLRAMGWKPGLAICLTGGIGPLYAPHLPSDMQSDLTPKQGDPLVGALSLAEDFSKEVADGGL